MEEKDENKSESCADDGRNVSDYLAGCRRFPIFFFFLFLFGLKPENYTFCKFHPGNVDVTEE